MNEELKSAVADYKETDDAISPDVFATIPKEETATIIVPLYGFYKNSPIDGLNAEVLQVSLLRLRSFFHKVYYVFVGEKGNVDPKIYNLLVTRGLAGNVLGVEVDNSATLAMYLDEGIKFALEKTASKYFVCAFPWMMVGKTSVDVLLERINRIDVSLCSGFDLRLENVQPSAFDTHVFNPAREFHGFEMGLFGFTRPVAQTVNIDLTYRTKTYLEKDLMQTFHSKGHNVITSQFIPIYTFNFDWSPVESEEDFGKDAGYFVKKWGFSPEVNK